MKILIIPVAGKAQRFNKDSLTPMPKCIFYRKNPLHTILYEILAKSAGFDHIVIVGGYLYESLLAYAETYLIDFLDKIQLVYNPEYATKGSGYSLYLGIAAAKKICQDQGKNKEKNEIIFVEGDLFFHADDFHRLVYADGNALSINYEPIRSNKAVVLYEDSCHHIKYLYDTMHQELYIPEPFLAIYNSAQMWKFTDIQRLEQICEQLTEEQLSGTNLEIINAYFSPLTTDLIAVISFATWVNCNTKDDYDLVFRHRKE